MFSASDFFNFHVLCGLFHASMPIALCLLDLLFPRPANPPPCPVQFGRRQHVDKEEEEEEEDEMTDAQLWQQVARNARSRAEHRRILKAWRQWEKASSAQRQQQQQHHRWGADGGWSFKAEFHWNGGGQGATWGSGGRRTRAYSFSWEDLFGSEEEQGWWMGGRQHHHRQHSRQQRPGQGAFAGGHTSSKVRSSLQALGLEEGATLTEDTLKAAFRRTALRWHPDRHPEAASKAHAEARFKDAQAAFQLLTSLVL
jgi:hypothetical protein